MCQYECKYWFRCGIFVVPLGETHSLNWINVRWLQAAAERFANWKRENAGSVSFSPGKSAALIPVAGRVGRALPRCRQQPAAHPRSRDFLALAGTAAGSYCWCAAERVACCCKAPSCKELCRRWMQKIRKKSSQVPEAFNRDVSFPTEEKSHSCVEAVLQKSNTAQGEICLPVLG